MVTCVRCGKKLRFYDVSTKWESPKSWNLHTEWNGQTMCDQCDSAMFTEHLKEEMKRIASIPNKIIVDEEAEINGGSLIDVPDEEILNRFFIYNGILFTTKSFLVLAYTGGSEHQSMPSTGKMVVWAFGGPVVSSAASLISGTFSQRNLDKARTELLKQRTFKDILQRNRFNFAIPYCGITQIVASRVPLQLEVNTDRKYDISIDQIKDYSVDGKGTYRRYPNYPQKYEIPLGEHSRRIYDKKYEVPVSQIQQLFTLLASTLKERFRFLG